MNIFNQVENTIKDLKKNSNKFVNQIINQESEYNLEHKTEQELKLDMEELKKPNLLESDPFKHNLNEYEKKLDNKFIGCYLDDPSNPLLTDYLGEVDNQEKCIIKGKDSNYQYVGIQQGNKCFGTNVLPDNLKKVERNKCNIKCNDKSKGNCGGNYYNQIYSTKLNMLDNINGSNDSNYLTSLDFLNNDDKFIMSTPNEIVEKYKNINIELFGINDNLSQDYFIENNPINPYILILWLIIIIIVIYLIIEYINKNSKNKVN